MSNSSTSDWELAHKGLKLAQKASLAYVRLFPEDALSEDIFPLLKRMLANLENQETPKETPDD